MKKFEDLTFTDHYMFEKVLKNPEICKELLERLLKIQIERLEYPEVEKTISPYYETKGVRLDVYVKDNNKVFDIELQNSTDSNLGLRTRYYQSMLDTDNLLKGQHYTELPDSYIVFICKNAPFERLMVSSLTNGTTGYVVTEPAFSAGVYESMLSKYNSCLPPKAADEMADCAVKLLKKMN
jgi:hypothetical protein